MIASVIGSTAALIYITGTLLTPFFTLVVVVIIVMIEKITCYYNLLVDNMRSHAVA